MVLDNIAAGSLSAGIFAAVNFVEGIFAVRAFAVGKFRQRIFSSSNLPHADILPT